MLRWKSATLAPAVLAGLASAAAGIAGNNKVYVANEMSGTVSVIDAGTNLVVTEIDLAEMDSSGMMHHFAPHNVQVAPDRETVWVTAPPDHDDPHGMEQVIVIDPDTDTIVQRIEVGDHQHLAHVELDGKSTHAYMTASAMDQVIDIDVATMQEVGRFDLSPGSWPHGLRYARGKLFVADMDGMSLSIIRLDDGSVTEVPLGGMAVQTAACRNSRLVLATLYDTREVVRYNDRTGELVRIPLPADSEGPIQLFLSPNEKHVYVCDQGYLMGMPASDKFYEIDVKRAKVTNEVTVGMGAHGVVGSRDGRYLYVTNLLDDSVSVVHRESFTVVATIPVGMSPNGIGYW
jgi:YVTN family beta-propeller protein